MQTLNVCFGSGKTTQALTLMTTGRIGAASWLATLPLVIVATAALWLGMRVRSRIEAHVYYRWLRAALFVIALLLIGRFFWSVVR